MINKLDFSIGIKTEKNKIWKALWNDNSYRRWASIFFEGSYIVVYNWEEGSTVLFLGPDQSGIYSLIEKHIPNEIIRFKHIGTVSKGKEQPINDETKLWSGAHETYKLSEVEKTITLSVEIDVLNEHLDFMNTKMPKALEKIKFLAENM